MRAGANEPLVVVDVACSQLSYSRGLFYQPGTFFKSDQTVLLDSVSCTGSETSLRDCNLGGWSAFGGELSAQCYSGIG